MRRRKIRKSDPDWRNVKMFLYRSKEKGRRDNKVENEGQLTAWVIDIRTGIEGDV